MPSTILTVKAAVVARLAADPLIGGNGATVTWGIPGAPNREPPRLWVYVGNTKSDDPTQGNQNYGAGMTRVALGKRTVEERYVLEVTVSCLGGMIDDPQTLAGIAFGFGNAIDTSIRNWYNTTPSSYDGLLHWALVTSMYHREGVAGGSDRYCEVFLDIACAART